MTAIDKFTRRGYTGLYYLPAIAVRTAPTSAEFTAGQNIRPGLFSLGGFTSAGTTIDTPDADTTFTSNIPGEERPEASSLTYYQDRITNVMRTLLAEGVTGYIVVCPQSKATGRRCTVWPIRVSAANDTIDFGNVSALEVFNFAITDKPEKNAVCP